MTNRYLENEPFLAGVQLFTDRRREVNVKLAMVKLGERAIKLRHPRYTLGIYWYGISVFWISPVLSFFDFGVVHPPLPAPPILGILANTASFVGELFWTRSEVLTSVMKQSYGMQTFLFSNLPCFFAFFCGWLFNMLFTFFCDVNFPLRVCYIYSRFGLFHRLVNIGFQRCNLSFCFLSSLIMRS